MTKTPILLVEDDQNDVFFFQRALRKAEIANPLSVVRDGREAMAYLAGQGAFADRARYPVPCLVILDLNLPHQHGLDVLRWIRKEPKLATLLVIVLTSSISEQDAHEAYRLGANSFLIKPADPNQLVELAKAIKIYWLQHNQWPPQWEKRRTPCRDRP